ncbi:MAG: hypothetical protein FI692_01400 [SAR202 cluster bacterium]|jgi:hypothetical protein|nr:hypothetical protein [SAR202 cluster bacterium]GIS83324.1 MAG: hypothetical protein CM1200mP15_19560 [Dehalococcoidia bacterium]|tara:strand:- start:413 stop:721 length:309 start_codon:yes stop_codon:yes gene_type:complete
MYPNLRFIHSAIQESAYSEATFKQICIACAKYNGIELDLPEDLGAQLPIDRVVQHLFEGPLDFGSFTMLGITLSVREKIYDELVAWTGRGCLDNWDGQKTPD